MYVAVAVVAACMGSAWALLTPPFQVPDEPSHFAYAQYLGETLRLPGGDPSAPQYSDEAAAYLGNLGAGALIGQVHVVVPAESDPGPAGLADTKLLRDNGGGRTGASSHPPLYYLLEALPYRVFSGSDLTLRMLMMRLLSVLFFTGSAVLVALLAAEFFPRTPWAPAVAGLSIGLQPVMGFIAGGVSPDSLLTFLAVALMLALVRGIRRPSARAAIWIGGVAGLGALSKLTFLAFLPAAVVGLLVVGGRVARNRGPWRGVTVTGVGAVALVAPLIVYVAWTVLQGRGLLPPGVSTPSMDPAFIQPRTNRELLSYMWQLYLPRVPGQVDFFGYSPIVNTWAHGFIGRYGWLDYGAPAWMMTLGSWILGLLGVLAVIGLGRNWRRVRDGWAELTVLGIAALGLLVLVASGGYEYKRTTGLVFEQARYLFPLAGLYGAAVVAACLSVGRRWAGTFAVVLVILAATHALSGLLLTVARYYG
ncbi:MAG: DUF2142 domain-containing protein [Solirubrobacteraceae bacterium]|nr:DUF2142 domain-containing protein [Solirubrobacteraceae bacterium]